MSRYQVALNPSDSNTPIPFRGHTYTTGDVFETDDACEFLTFLREARAMGRPQRQVSSWLLEGAADDCLQRPPEQAVSTTDPTQSEPAPRDEPPSGRRPDTPATLAAPRAPADIASGDPRASGTDPRPPSTRAQDPERPVSLNRIYDEARSTGQSHTQAQERAERARRGDPEPGAPHPSRSDARDPDAAHEGDPIDLFSGEFALWTLDLELPSRGLPLQLQRRYQSGRAAYGPFGFQWDHNYNVYIRQLDGGNVAVWIGSLREAVFTGSAEGFSPPPGFHWKLERVSDGYVLLQPGGITWTFSRPSTWPNPLTIPLISITDRFGNRQDLNYESTGLLARVDDRQGNFFAFEYGSCGLLERVTDSAARQIRYFHADNIEHLIGVEARFVPAIVSERTSYVYDDGASHPALRHNLICVLDGRGRPVVENTYGRDASEYSFNRVVRQVERGCEMLLGYEQLAAPHPWVFDTDLPVWQTSVLSDSGLRVYTFNARGQLLDDRMRLRQDGTYRVWINRYRYNHVGDLVEVQRPSGESVLYEYSADDPDPRNRGNLVQVGVRAPMVRGGGTRVLWRARYVRDLQLPEILEDEHGRTWGFTYGSNGLQRVEHPTVTLPDGSEQTVAERFERDRWGQLTRHVGAEGTIHTLRHDHRGLLIEESWGEGPDQVVRQITHDARGAVTSVSSNGQLEEYSYNDRGLLSEYKVSISGEQIPVLKFEYDELGQLVRLLHPRGEAVDDLATAPWLADQFDYDAFGRLIRRVRNANARKSQQTTFRRDSAGRATQYIDPLGRRFGMKYDERGLLLETTESHSGRVYRTRYSYDIDGQLTRIEEEGGPSIAYGYDQWGRSSRIEEIGDGPDDAMVTVMEYRDGDTPTRLTTSGSDGYGGRRVLADERYRYDEKGRRISIATTDGTDLVYYDGEDRIVRMVEPDGAETRFTYDTAARVRQVTGPTDQTTNYEYNANGLTQSVDVRASSGETIDSIHYEYDEAGRTVSTRGDSGGPIRLEWDLRGALVRMSAPGLPAWEFRNDVNGLIVERSSQIRGVTFREHWERDRVGQIISHTDVAGSQTRWLRPNGIDVAMIEQPDGRRKSWMYGPRGELVEETLPSGSQYRLEYDHRSRLTHISATTGPGIAATPDVQVHYDGFSRPTRIRFGDITTQFIFDREGRIVSESTGARPVRWAYRRATREVDFEFPDTRLSTFHYDEGGRVIQIEHGRSGEAGLLSGIPAGRQLAEYSYDLRGARNEVRRLNQTTTRYRYDRAGHPLSIEHSAATDRTIAEFAAQWDEADRQTRSTIHPGREPVRSYRYDDWGRLVEVSEGLSEASLAIKEIFILDAAGNRLRAEERRDNGSVVREVSYDAAHRAVRLVSTGAEEGTFTFRHNGDGATTEDDRRRIVYDAFGQAVEIFDTAGRLILTQRFDALGRVFDQTNASGQTERLVWAGQRLIQRESATGEVLEQIQFGPMFQEELVRSRPGVDLWSHDDTGFNTIARTDGSGTVAARYSFSAFGVPRILHPTTLAPVSLTSALAEPSFAGRPFNAQTGLYDMRARLYDPRLGRFLQPDPEGTADAPSPFVYADHDPVNYSDPTGEIAESVWDALSLSMGLVSLSQDWRRGGWGWFALDFLGCVVDAAALLLPFVPGGAGAGLRSVRMALGVRTVQVSERTIRQLQVANQALNVAQGINSSYEAARHGEDGAAAFYFGVSVIGMHGMFSGIRHARELGAVTPSTVFSVQGNLTSITLTSRIWAGAESTVWGHSLRTPNWFQSGVQESRFLRLLAQGGAQFVFRDTAALLFRPPRVSGLFSFWKYHGGQLVAGFGDLHLRNVTPSVPLASRPFGLDHARAYVSEAVLLPGSFAGMSRTRAYFRPLFPATVDWITNTAPGALAALFGYADAPLEPGTANGVQRESRATHRRAGRRGNPLDGSSHDASVVGGAFAPENRQTPKS
jgi:RHS repeat-associated protein